MALKGTKSKNEITEKILSSFKEAFIYNKEIRIPCQEDGVSVQIKVTLTCAKENVDINGAAAPSVGSETNDGFPEVKSAEPSEAEIAQVNSLMEKLGL